MHVIILKQAETCLVASQNFFLFLFFFILFFFFAYTYFIWRWYCMVLWTILHCSLSIAYCMWMCAFHLCKECDHNFTMFFFSTFKPKYLLCFRWVGAASEHTQNLGLLQKLATRLHGKIEKSYWPEWELNPLPFWGVKFKGSHRSTLKAGSYQVNLV